MKMTKGGNDEWSLGVVLTWSYVLANLSLESLKLVLIIRKACTLSAGVQNTSKEYRIQIELAHTHTLYV